MKNIKDNSFYKNLETEINNYINTTIEISEDVKFSQYALIKRLYKFRNRDLSGSKLNSDLSYNYYFDIISPRSDAEIKNLRFDTKNIMLFSQNPRKDFAAIFLMNASLKEWMNENGEDEQLKDAVEEFVTNGNIGFKKIKGGYEKVDAINTYITNQTAKTVNDTAIIEKHEYTASELKSMKAWNEAAVDATIIELGNNTFQAGPETTSIETTTKRYEVYEYTGEISEKDFNAIQGMEGGDEHNYFLAKVIISGLKKGHTGDKYVLYAQKLIGDMEDYYIYAHRGKYEGRFWRVGMYELLFDHQIRANEIGNQLAQGLEWASKTIFRSKDRTILQNLRADMDNGDVVITEDLQQINFRMSGMDQLVADWNRVMEDADRLSNSYEVVRGETPTAGTPLGTTKLMDANAGKLYVMLRQKIALPYRRVFREWVLPELVKDMKGKDIFRLVGDTDMMEQLREVLVDSWYLQNLVAIGPHTKEQAEAIKQEKMEQLEKEDPAIENSREIWEGVLPRTFVTITGENSDLTDQLQDLVSLMNLETDPERIAYLLDTIYKIRGIPVPPKKEEPVQQFDQNGQPIQPQPQRRLNQAPGAAEAATPTQ